MASKAKSRLSFTRITKNSPSLSGQKAAGSQGACGNDSDKSIKKTEKSTVKDNAPIRSSQQFESMHPVSPIERQEHSVSQQSRQAPLGRENSRRQHNIISYIFGSRPSGKKQLPRNHRVPSHHDQLSYFASNAATQPSRAFVRAVSTDSFTRFISSYDSSYAQQKPTSTRGRMTSINSSDLDFLQPRLGHLRVMNGPVSPEHSNDVTSSRISKAEAQANSLSLGRTSSHNRHDARQSISRSTVNHSGAHLPALSVSPSTPPVERPGNRLRVVNRSGSMNTTSTFSTAFKSPPPPGSFQAQCPSTQISRAHTVHQSPLPRDYLAMPLSSFRPSLGDLLPDQEHIRALGPGEGGERAPDPRQYTEDQDQQTSCVDDGPGSESDTDTDPESELDESQVPLYRRNNDRSNSGESYKTARSISSSMANYTNEQEKHPLHSQTLQASKDRLSRFTALCKTSNTAADTNPPVRTVSQKVLVNRVLSHSERPDKATSRNTSRSQPPHAEISSCGSMSHFPLSVLHTSLTPDLSENGEGVRDHNFKTGQSEKPAIASVEDYEPLYIGYAVPVCVRGLKHAEYDRLLNGRSLTIGDPEAAGEGPAATISAAESSNGPTAGMRPKLIDVPSPRVRNPVTAISNAQPRNDPATDTRLLFPDVPVPRARMSVVTNATRSRNGPAAGARPSFVDVSSPASCNSVTRISAASPSNGPAAGTRQSLVSALSPRARASVTTISPVQPSNGPANGTRSSLVDVPNSVTQESTPVSRNHHRGTNEKGNDNDQLQSDSSPTGLELRCPAPRKVIVPSVPTNQPTAVLQRVASKRIKTRLQKALSRNG